MKFVVKYFSEIAIKSKPVRHVSGITCILKVRNHPLPALDEIVAHALPRLRGAAVSYMLD